MRGIKIENITFGIKSLGNDVAIHMTDGGDKQFNEDEPQYLLFKNCRFIKDIYLLEKLKIFNLMRIKEAAKP